MNRLAGIGLLFLLIGGPRWAASGYTAANERERFAESFVPEDSEMQYFTSGAQSQIINVALSEKDSDDVTCDAIIANILVDVQFTIELKAHGFTYVGCGTAVAPLIVRSTNEQQRCPIDDNGRMDA
jgi:hypothetical protein